MTSGRWPSNFLLTHNSGCRKIGVKRVKGSSRIDRKGEAGGLPGTTLAGSIDGSLNALQSPGYADSDGLETIGDWRCTENCPVRRLGEQSGIKISRWGKPASEGGGSWFGAGNFGGRQEEIGKFIGDKGTAARFYFQADWSYERIEWEELWQRGE